MITWFRRSRQHLFTLDERFDQLRGLVEDCDELLALAAEAESDEPVEGEPEVEESLPTEDCEATRDRALEFLNDGWEDDHELYELTDLWRGVVSVDWEWSVADAVPIYTPRAQGPAMEEIETRIQAALGDLRAIGEVRDR